MEDLSAVCRGWANNDVLITALQQLVPNKLPSNTILTDHLQHIHAGLLQKMKSRHYLPSNCPQLLDSGDSPSGMTCQT